jgi:acetyl esterase
MEFDPELVACLKDMPDSDPGNPVAMRAAQGEMLRQATGGVLATDERVTFTDHRVPGRWDAPEVKIRVYRPRSGGGAMPAFVYIHGGGFVAGSMDLGHGRALMVAAEVGCVVVSVEYRLAPEHRFPAGLDDCFTALSWTASHADEIGVDRSRVAVGGESAGGALAAGVTLMARDRGGPDIAFQLLLYPVLDDRMGTASMDACASAPVWDTAKCRIMWRHYLGDHGGAHVDDVSPYAAPARASNLAGLPPAYVSVCEGDPLRDEGIAYASRLLHAGVTTELHVFPRTFHGFDLVGMTTAVGKRALEEQLSALRRALGTCGS